MMDSLKSLMNTRRFHTCSVMLRKEIPTNIKNKSPSSQRWLTRQIQDPYVEKARQLNYRCRSAFKLLEMNERFDFITHGMTVLDCGAAPGSWTQVATVLTNSAGTCENKPKGCVIAVDKLPIHPIEGATVLGNVDFTTETTQKRLRDFLNGSLVDVVMSDMAPNATGVREIDHEQIIYLAYAALKFALQISEKNASFIAKLWDGVDSPRFEKDIGKFYKKLKIVRPAATRDESSERFILARGFVGLK